MTADRIIIISCSDHLMWYSDKVGTSAPLVRDLPDEGCYLSRETSGLLNIVKHIDARPMPNGYRELQAHELLQHGDLLLNRRGDARRGLTWRTVEPTRIATPAGNELAIRLITRAP